MTYAERSFAGPDIHGRTFRAEPCLHVAWYHEDQRLKRKRQAIIEHNRLMKGQRQFAARNRERIAAEWDAQPVPPIRATDHIAAVRSDPDRWDKAEKEWEE